MHGGQAVEDNMMDEDQQQGFLPTLLPQQREAIGASVLRSKGRRASSRAAVSRTLPAGNLVDGQFRLRRGGLPAVRAVGGGDAAGQQGQVVTMARQAVASRSTSTPSTRKARGRW